MVACPPPRTACASAETTHGICIDACATASEGGPGAIYRRGFSAGSLASIFSTAVIAVRSKIDGDNFFCGTNATSHWLWGERAFRQAGFSVRYTLIGYLIHHLCSVFWATCFTAWRSWRMRTTNAVTRPENDIKLQEPNVRSRTDRRRDLKECVAMGMLAATIDYTITPRRFKPGYERHLRLRSLFGVYGAFGAGLALGTCCLDVLARRRSGPTSKDQR